MIIHFDISRDKSIAALEKAMVEDQKIFLVLQREQNAENPGQKEMYEVGTVASVRQIIKLPKKILRVLVAGEARGILKSIEYETPYLRAEVEILDESDFQSPEDLNGQAMIRRPERHFRGLCREKREDVQGRGRTDPGDQ